MKPPTPSEAARILGASGASKGGRALAAKSTAKQRSARARKAARARWEPRRCSTCGKRPSVWADGGQWHVSDGCRIVMSTTRTWAIDRWNRDQGERLARKGKAHGND
jgi:hypothetical protein